MNACDPTVILDRLRHLHSRNIDLSFTRIDRLLATLGRPEARLPPTIHVAGTNGKGSTIAFLRAMLEADGRRVHVFTSPHLLRFNERIRLGGQIIDDDLLTKLLLFCERHNNGLPITFFEIITAAAFLAFAEHPADVLLLETGLGGRCDATNIIPTAQLCVITAIGLDHQDYLGTTLAAIAGEKAGIIKSATPLVHAADAISAMIFDKRAQSLGAPLFRRDKEWSAQPDDQGRTWSYRDPMTGSLGLTLPAPILAGTYQYDNAALAVAAVRRFDPMIATAAISAGLRNAVWPARMQPITSGPARQRIPLSWSIWLDGGHNPNAAAALAHHFRRRNTDPAPLLWVICNLMRNKDAAGWFAAFAACGLRLAGAIPTLPAQITDANVSLYDPEALAKMAESFGFYLEIVDDFDMAFAVISAQIKARADRSKGDLLITGSLYLAGAFLAWNGKDNFN